jgi:GYF domain 2
MNWYFEEHGVIKGPFPEGDFADMVRRRDVPADALVWRPGLEEWATAQEINPPWLKNIASGLQPARQQQAPGAPQNQAAGAPKEPASVAPKQQAPAPAGQQVSSPPKDPAPAAPKLQVSAPTNEQVSGPPKDPVPTVTKLQVSAPTKGPAPTSAKNDGSGPSKDGSGPSKEQANNAEKPATTPPKESLPVIEGAIPNQAAASTPARTMGQSKLKPMAPIPTSDQNQPTEKGGLLKRVFGIGGKQKS